MFHRLFLALSPYSCPIAREPMQGTCLEHTTATALDQLWQPSIF